MKKVIFLIVILSIGIFIFLDTREESPDSNPVASEEAIALYAEPLIFEELVRDKADAIIIGTIESKGKPFVSVALEESELQSTSYIINIDEKIKGFETKESFQINILEPRFLDLQIGEQVFLYIEETQRDYYVPLTAEYGLKMIKDGQVIGQFLKEEHRSNSTEFSGSMRGLELEVFINDIESVLW